MAPKLTVIYFDIPGLAEPVRWALELSGLEWTDKRFTREEFGPFKSTFPNEQLPVLEIDGFMLPQSMAMLRYVGKLGGLYPTDDLEAAKCDAIMDCTVDLVYKVIPILSGKDEAKKMELTKDLTENFLPKWLTLMSKHLEVGGNNYFLGKMTVADILIAGRLAWLKAGVIDGIPTTIFDAHPNLNAHVASIVEEPKVAAFIEKHKE